MNLYRAGAKTCSPRCRQRVSRRAKTLQKRSQSRVFPAEMTSKTRWIRRETSKRPITVTGRSASTTNPATWSTHAEALASSKGVGLGYVLGDGIGAIDLDHCFQGGELLPWAAEILTANPSTFVEVSQSGEGLHIFGYLPENTGSKHRDGANVEVYSWGRYFAVTGERYGDAPLNLEPLSVPAKYLK